MTRHAENTETGISRFQEKYNLDAQEINDGINSNIHKKSTHNLQVLSTL